MTTQCNQKLFEFHPEARRQVKGRFDGGAITSEGGGLLLREVEKRTNIAGSDPTHTRFATATHPLPPVDCRGGPAPLSLLDSGDMRD